MKSPIEISEGAITELINNGGMVSITYVESGQILKREEKLKEFDKKSSLEFFIEGGSSYLPLLGVGCAVQEVADKNGNTLYKNNMVDETYCEAASKDIRRECGFGDLFAL